MTLLSLCALLATAQKVIPGSSLNQRSSFTYTLSGSCETVIQPDMAVIAGGVSATALKPTMAAQQLEKQLGVLSNYVQSLHGQVVLLERVRSLQAPSTRNSNNNEDGDQPAEIVQRLHIELPAQAPVDEILDRLIQLGLDRYGENVLASRSRQRSAAVYFRFSRLDAILSDLRQSCLQAAWKKQCLTDLAPKACASGSIPSAGFLPENFSVRSQEKLLRANDGFADYLRLNFSPGGPKPDPPMLLGNQPVAIQGDLNVQFREDLP